MSIGPTLLERPGANALFSNCIHPMVSRQLKHAEPDLICSAHTLRIPVAINSVSHGAPFQEA